MGKFLAGFFVALGLIVTVIIGINIKQRIEFNEELDRQIEEIEKFKEEHPCYSITEKETDTGTKYVYTAHKNDQEFTIDSDVLW